MEKLLYTIGELLMTEADAVDNVTYDNGNMNVVMCDGSSYVLKLEVL